MIGARVNAGVGCFAVVAALALASCSGHGSTAPGTGRSGSTAHASAAPASTAAPSASSIISSPTPTSPTPTATVRPGDSTHPGAAVLAGDVGKLPSAAVIPALTAAPKDIPVYAAKGCEVTQSSSTPIACSFGDTTAPKVTVALVGDSVAGQWLPPLQLIAAARHWKIVTVLRSRCAFTATMTVNSGSTAPYTSCHEWGVRVLADLITKIKPDVVITSDRPVLGTPDHPEFDADTLAAIGDGMATYWRTLIAHHIAVVAMRETPETHIDEPACIAKNSGDLGPCSVSVAKAIPPVAPTVIAAAQVAAARLIDMNSLICGRNTCVPVVGNVLVYRDRHHLTTTYTRTMTPYLEQKLRTVPALSS